MSGGFAHGGAGYGSKAMRILMVSPPWLPVPPVGYGGIEVVVDGLARALTALGHEVHLFATGDSTCPVERHFIHPEAIGTGATHTAAMLAHVLAAYDLAERLRPDIVHDHTIIGPFIGRERGIDTVTTNHNMFDDNAVFAYEHLGDAARIIAISHAHADLGRARGIDPFAVIHHGLDIERVPIGTGAGGYAAFLGRMSPAKGVHIAIDAARAAGVPLRIAAKMAEPAERAYFDAEVAPRLGDGIEFIGQVSGRDKQRFLGDAMCLLNPIQWDEPFGMVMIESLATGTPVIVTRRGAAPELIADGITGILTDSGEELPKALVDIRQIDRRTCRQQAQMHFSLARMAHEHVAVYQRAIGERRMSRASA